MSSEKNGPNAGTDIGSSNTALPNNVTAELSTLRTHDGSRALFESTRCEQRQPTCSHVYRLPTAPFLESDERVPESAASNVGKQGRRI